MSPLRELWTIAWPTVLTMTSYTLMQFVDALMVSAVGPIELAAQGNGGIAAFVPLSFVMGMLTVVNTFVSQNLGAGRPERGPRYAWGAIWISLVAWIALIPYALLIPAVFARLHDPALARLESGYTQILIFGCALTLMSRGLSHFFYGMHRPKVIFVATIAGNLTNVLFNWLLIFGHFGFPALGLAGAAIGTLIGTAVELAIPLAIFLGPIHRELGTRSKWRPDRDALRGLIRIGWPKSIQFGNEMVCWAIFMVVLVGIFGKAHMAAGWITLRYMHLSFMPAIGISVAVTAVVGRYIGAGQLDTANQRAWLGVRLAMAYMGTCAVFFVLFREPLIRLFVMLSADANPEIAAMTNEVVEVGSKLLICAAAFQVFDALAVALSGALNGAGDTIWPGVATVVTSWLFIIGVGWGLARLAPQLESLGPWIGSALFIISLSLLLLWRWRSGKWREIRLVGDETEPIRMSADAVAPEPIVEPKTGAVSIGSS